MPLLNTLLRQLLKKKAIKIFSLGTMSTLITYNIEILGNTLLKFLHVLENKSQFSYYIIYKSFFLSTFLDIKIFNYINKAIIVGEDFFFIKNAYKLLWNFINYYNINYKHIYILFTTTITLHYQELGLKVNKKFIKEILFIYSFTNKIQKKKKNSFAIMQSTNFFKGIKNYNVIIPCNSFFEYNGFFFNFVGRLKKKIKIIKTKMVIKSTLDIVIYLYYLIEKGFNFNNFNYNLMLFFKNLLQFNYIYFYVYYKHNIVILNKLYIKNFINYRLNFIDNLFFGYVINMYNINNIYKLSYILQKAYTYVNTYINVYSY
jgi:hypothetical protein